MARGSKIIFNRKTVRAIPLAVLDGLFECGRTVIETADPPDAPPYGQGLLEGGGVIGYVDGKKVADSLIGGRAISKPRGVSVKDSQVVVIVGWGFPARLVEFGTIDTSPHPFFTPARDRVRSSMPAIAAPIIRQRLEELAR